MKCITTHKKLGKSGVLQEKIDIFPTVSLYFHPSPLKIRVLPPYEIYVFGRLGPPVDKKKFTSLLELKIL